MAQEGVWSEGLCDCCSDCKVCCLTLWCPCIAFGRIAEIADQGETSCVSAGAGYALLLWLLGSGWMFSCFYRTKIRRQYMLRNSPCNDCLVHWCCEPCALCQEYKELENRGFDMSLGWAGKNMEKRGGVQMAPVHKETMNR